jgi:hypothetical protein
MMEAIVSSATSILSRATRLYISETASITGHAVLDVGCITDATQAVPVLCANVSCRYLSHGVSVNKTRSRS